MQELSSAHTHKKLQQQKRPKLDTKVRAIAYAVRKKIERLAKKHPHYSNPKTLDTMCAIASYELYTRLKAFGLKQVDFVEGRCHCWVVVDDKTIVDVTYTQFDTSAKKVSIFPAQYEYVPNLHYSYNPVRKNAKAFRDIRCNWPYEQRPPALLSKA